MQINTKIKPLYKCPELQTHIYFSYSDPSPWPQNCSFSLSSAALTHTSSGQQSSPPFTQSFIQQICIKTRFKVSSTIYLTQDFTPSSFSLTCQQPDQLILCYPLEFFSMILSSNSLTFPNTFLNLKAPSLITSFLPPTFPS